MTTPITLSQLIAELEKQDPELGVQFDFCSFAPQRFISWRGRYEDLAITYEENLVVTVADFLNLCRDTVNQIMTGYKGGEYRMDGDTPVYVQNYGDYSWPSTTIKKIKVIGETVILKTGLVE